MSPWLLEGNTALAISNRIQQCASIHLVNRTRQRVVVAEWSSIERTTLMTIRQMVYVVIIMISLIAGGVVEGTAAPGTPASGSEPGNRDVILATTTSTQDSGLLDVLVPQFAEQSGYQLKPVAVGSGAALELGERGEADVLLVHSPAAEVEYMEAGHGADRRLVMFNDFIVVGPSDDPAAIGDDRSVVAALQKIAEDEAIFVSRGDDSGTHALERHLWEEAGIEPRGSWYQESGTGMGDTLNIANERQGYTISDRGSYLSRRDQLDLDILVEADPLLVNVYHVITVAPQGRETINTVGAVAFLQFMLDPATQQVIGEFGLEEFGQPLFTPCADNSCGIEPTATPLASPVST